MIIANDWKDYKIIDMADGQKLERWGNIILSRPDPQIIWTNKSFPEKWKKADAVYSRSKTGGGAWKYNKKLLKFVNENPDDLKGVCGNCLARSLCRGGCRLHAMSKYLGDFYAPDPDCQKVYDIGMFPEYALDDVEKVCNYEK